jgi:hypothetical protein
MVTCNPELPDAFLPLLGSGLTRSAKYTITSVHADLLGEGEYLNLEGDDGSEHANVGSECFISCQSN